MFYVRGLKGGGESTGVLDFSTLCIPQPTVKKVDVNSTVLFWCMLGVYSDAVCEPISILILMLFCWKSEWFHLNFNIHYTSYIGKLGNECNET